LKLLSIQQELEDAFVWSLKKALGDKVDRERDVLLYVHGYNVTFESAALRAAQLEVDLNAAGATAFFSWPSKGVTQGYLADEEAIRISEKPLLRFMRLLHEKVQTRRIHVLVHSMGNRALARLADSFGHLRNPVLGEVVLAAPDVNVIEFKDQAKAYKAVASRTTMYASSGDRALLASKTIHAQQRAGQLPPPIVVDGVHTIDVSNTDLSFMGHGYYGTCEAVLYDMHELFVAGLPPGKRARLQEVASPEGGIYWRIRR
jgi:esterase/lipase superfamily enzyme